MNTTVWTRRGASLVWIAVLAACGGGGGGSSDGSGSPAALSLSGVAAEEGAIAGQAIEVKCAAGSGSGTTGPDGSFALTITAGQLPCLVRVSGANANGTTVLYSVTSASGSHATANVTPLTHLIVARLTGTMPSAYYASFDGAAAAAVTPAAVSSATTGVVTQLTSAGLDLASAGDPITGPLTAGNAYGTALDALAGALSNAGSTLDTLTETVAQTSPAPIAASTPSSLPSLPADMLLRTAASNCAALRTGTYRMISPKAGAALADQFSTVVVNASTLTVTFPDGSVGAWVANGPCRYLGDSGKTDLVVSQAGVIVARYTDDNGATYNLAFGFPEQSHSVAELAGDWNLLGLELNGAGTYTGIAGHGSISSSGTQSAVTWCQDDSTWSLTGSACTGATAPPAYRANGTAGFDVVDTSTNTVSGRAFAYQAGGGELMVAQVDGDGSFHVRTKQRTNALPTVGTVSTVWNFATGNHLTSTAVPLSETSNTIVSTDTAAGSWLRTLKTVGTSDDHPETLFANNPRDGYTFRGAGTATAVNGSTVTIREFTALGLRGMGLTALLLPGLRWFMLSAGQP